MLMVIAALLGLILLWLLVLTLIFLLPAIPHLFARLKDPFQRHGAFQNDPPNQQEEWDD